jgi:hypothetical protein
VEGRTVRVEPWTKPCCFPEGRVLWASDQRNGVEITRPDTCFRPVPPTKIVDGKQTRLDGQK